MIKTISIFLGISLTLAAVCGMYYYNLSQKELAKTQATLFVESGIVATKVSGEGEYSTVSTQTLKILSGTFVRTDTGRAYVTLPDTSVISIEPFTEIQVTFSPTKTTIAQMAGNTYHRVRALTAGDSYEVVTPTNVASVRGTKFAVSYSTTTKMTKVAVTEHRVAVYKPEEQAEEPKYVEEGQVLRSEQSPNSEPGTQKDAITMMKIEDDPDMDWVRTNMTLDPVFDSSKDRSDKEASIIEHIEKVQDPSESTINKDSDTKQEASPSEEKKSPEQVTREKKDDTPVVKTPIVEEKKVAPAAPPKKAALEQPVITTTVLKKIAFSADEISPAEEAYLNDFYDLYESLLYLGDRDLPCAVVKSLTGNDILARLVSFAKNKGYELPKQPELLSLGKNVVAYCNGDPTLPRDALNSMFDEAYPYSE